MREHDKAGKMTLNTREFDVNGQKIVMGHDRETGKRYYIDNRGMQWPVHGVNLTMFLQGENFVSIDTGLGELILFSDMEDPEKVLAEVKAIFWIE